MPEFDAKHFRRARIQAGKTQLQVGLEVGLTEGAIHNYETGRSRPKKGMILGLAQAVHCTAAFLAGDGK